MPDPITPADEAVLERRRFLRGSAMLAAAAGGAVAASAGSVLPASAEPTNYLAITFGIPAERLLDTRSEEGRKVIVASSESALDSKNRLKKGAYIDVSLGSTDSGTAELQLLSVFVTVTSRESTKGGSLSLSQTGTKPTGRTLSFDKGKTISTGTIVGTSVLGEDYVLRIYASATGHVTLDLTGVVIVGPQDETGPILRSSNPAGVERVLKMARVNGR